MEWVGRPVGIQADWIPLWNRHKLLAVLGHLEVWVPIQLVAWIDEDRVIWLR